MPELGRQILNELLPNLDHDSPADAALDDVPARLDHLGEPDFAGHVLQVFPDRGQFPSAAKPSCRSAIGRMTESMPSSDTPRKINGATDVGKSMPPASPQAATAPP